MSKRKRIRTRAQPPSEGDRINSPRLNPRKGSSMGTGQAVEGSDEQEDDGRQQPQDGQQDNGENAEESVSRQAPEE
jgi:hypothetical protein